MPGQRILVIEDNPLNLELVRALLEAQGYEVIESENAEDGIERARTEHPQLIFMDLSLPGTDGLAATQLLKADAATRHIPVVALTAHAMKGDDERARQAGCDGYMTKPIDTRSFPAAVARFLEREQG
ncbi:MAG TPA: response regulator [Vicinamibacterales bacterium]|jgi:two-component system cell cycle response regulator DivK